MLVSKMYYIKFFLILKQEYTFFYRLYYDIDKSIP